MPDAKPTPSPTDKCDNNDGVVLLMLTTGDQRPWSVDEVVREHGDCVQALDALAHLYGAGLIHRTQDGFVWATRAAIHAEAVAL